MPPAFHWGTHCFGSGHCLATIPTFHISGRSSGCLAGLVQCRSEEASCVCSLPESESLLLGSRLLCKEISQKVNGRASAGLYRQKLGEAMFQVPPAPPLAPYYSVHSSVLWSKSFSVRKSDFGNSFTQKEPLAFPYKTLFSLHLVR